MEGQVPTRDSSPDLTEEVEVNEGSAHVGQRNESHGRCPTPEGL